MKRFFWFSLSLAGIAFLVFIFFRKEKPHLAPEVSLIQIDTAQVTSLVVSPPRGEEWIAKRESGRWIVSRGHVSVIALAEPLDRMLAELASVKARGPVTQQRDDWEAYGVDDESGARIEVFSGGEKMEDFVLGQIERADGTDEVFTFVRLAGQLEVFAARVDSLRAWLHDFEGFRSRQFLRFDTANVSALWWARPDTTILFAPKDARWMVADVELPPSFRAYLQHISNQSGSRFKNDFDLLTAAEKAAHTLTIERVGEREPLVVSAYVDTLKPLPFVWHSSQYPGNFFEEDSTGLFEALIRPLYDWVERDPKAGNTE